MKKTDTKRIGFFRRNAVYLVLAFCILAIGLSLALILTNKPNVIDEGNHQEAPIENPEDKPKPENPEPDDKPDTPAPSEPVSEQLDFILPVSSSTEITAYTETLAYSATLGRFAAHKAVDFYCEEGTAVYATEKGTVESVTKDLLKGVTVVIDHGEGLKTVYNSLSEDTEVTAGQTVKKGDKIGEVSTTNRQEYKSGAHLHFEVLEKGESVDPAKYLSFDEK